LAELGHQETGDLFSYSIVVADNDRDESARPLVTEFAATSNIAVTYCVEPRQNIALTRNKAIEHAAGDFVAFIDDDESPTDRWLLTLLKACAEYHVDGVLGPVKPRFDERAPAWVIKGGFYDRATYPTGFVIDWSKGRTGNVLLKKAIFEKDRPPFRPEFLSGEDQDFFRRMMEKGHAFVWCNEAVAYETVPPVRWKRTFMLRRALFQGAVSLAHPSSKAVTIPKSAVAAPLYLLSLPLALVLGQSMFMTCLVKLCDHIGRLLAVVGIRLVREPYVTE
jgi:succinoglycan biosynthesis protein ExoM